MPPANSLLRKLLATSFALTAALLATAPTATAASPRWVSGPPFFNTWRVPISWYTDHPLYFTDPGDLSASVNHAAADAIVARAAAVWNIPSASLVLAQGGSLDEHVSSADVYASVNGPVFPSDVQSANFASKQIAVIYDTDGSVTDLLLGSGASDPTGCLQNAVTESVDSFGPEARIHHALLILNGRCTGPAPEMQLQMQYQLVRAFGRMLGLGWSQTNDNVFTGAPLPTHDQALNWPLMHPIDIICGPYTYQCFPEPFTLRPDDISALQSLYFIRQGEAAPGKIASWTNAGGAYGYVNFPNGQGMEGVNVVLRRRVPFNDTPEDWQTVSSVSGFGFRAHGYTPVSPSGSSPLASMGVAEGSWEGFWRIQSVPIPPSLEWNDLVITTEPINPLYSGPYAIGPQAGNTISPSGSPTVQVAQYLAPGRDNYAEFVPSDAAFSCATQADGSEGSPATVPQAGWWNGTLCGYGHQAWSALDVKANRTFTIEVTALDENGLLTFTKAMPTLGVWKSTDPAGTLPTVAAAPSAFNSASLAATSLHLTSSTAASFRFVVADQRGAGRPDFNYGARLLYADSVAPANVPSSGNTVTITGMGFRQGNTVLVNGVAATVLSWSPSSIVAVAPSLHALGLSRATTASITVQDPATGGSSTMTAALRYAAPVEALQLVSAPSGTLTSGTVAPASFSVRAIAPDGFTPVVGEAVNFVATGATFSQCAASSCVILTDSTGLASTLLTPSTPGTVTLSATGRSGTAQASFTARAAALVLHLVSAPSGVIATGAVASSPLQVQFLSSDSTAPRSGIPVTISLLAGAARIDACAALPCTLPTDSLGLITTSVTPTGSGPVSIQFASASSTVTATFSAAPETIRIQSAPAPAGTVGLASAVPFAVKLLAADGSTPLPGRMVVFSAAGAPVQFDACNAAVCTVPTDSQGIAQTTVTPTGVGSSTLSAIAAQGSLSATISSVPPPIRSTTPTHPVQYVAEDAAIILAPEVTLSDNSAPTSGVSVSWTGAPGLVFPAPTSISGSASTASALAALAPLSAGSRVQATACAWGGSICTPLVVQAVTATDWTLTVVSGAAQSVSTSDTLAPVVVQVVTANGDPIAGARVEIRQAVTEWEVSCPDAGRCPIASVLSSSQTFAVSDANGLVSIAPAETGGVPSIIHIAAITGTSGFVTISVQKHP